VSIEQFRVGTDNFSYVVHCARTRKAVLVDPSGNASEAMRFIGSGNLELVAVIDTHHHRDHISDNLRVSEAYNCDILASEEDARHIAGVTGFITDGQVMELGDVRIRVMLTPGHTPGSVCLLVDDSALLTGDTLFIGDCGRTDLPGGNDRQMYDTIQKLKELPDDVVVYPGHDYGDRPFDTIGNQKRTNKVMLAESYGAFARIT